MKQAPTPLSDHTMTLQTSTTSKQITLYAVTLCLGGGGAVFSSKSPQFFPIVTRKRMSQPVLECFPYFKDGNEQ
jgi:hypothetical protein